VLDPRLDLGRIESQVPTDLAVRNSTLFHEPPDVALADPETRCHPIEVE
jgi:hypothetical protein